MYDSGRYEYFGDWYVDGRGVERWQERLVGRTPASRYVTVACDVLKDGRMLPGRSTDHGLGLVPE